MPDKQNNPKYCPVSVTQNILMGKWKLAILWIISQKTRRFNELQKLIPKVSRGVLTQQLRELERDQLLHREVYREIPPKVEYSLTETGKSFIPVMLQIMEWGVGYVKATANCNMDICISNKFSCYRCYEMLKAGACTREIEKLSSPAETEHEMSRNYEGNTRTDKSIYQV